MHSHHDHRERLLKTPETRSSCISGKTLALRRRRSSRKRDYRQLGFFTGQIKKQHAIDMAKCLSNQWARRSAGLCQSYLGSVPTVRWKIYRSLTSAPVEPSRPCAWTKHDCVHKSCQNIRSEIRAVLVCVYRWGTLRRSRVIS